MSRLLIAAGFWLLVAGMALAPLTVMAKTIALPRCHKFILVPVPERRQAAPMPLVCNVDCEQNRTL